MLGSLTSLELHCANDQMLANFSFPRLQRLQLSGAGVKISNLCALLPRFPALTMLAVGGDATVPFAGRDSALQSNAMTILLLTSCTVAADDISAALAAFPSLQALTVMSASFGLQPLFSICSARPKELILLDYRRPGTLSVGAETLQWLLASCPKLRVLMLPKNALKVDGSDALVEVRTFFAATKQKNRDFSVHLGNSDHTVPSCTNCQQL